MNFAYTTNGKLFIARDGKAPWEIDSEFVSQVTRRHQQSVDRHHWKSSGGDGAMSYNLWNRTQQGLESSLVKVQSACESPNGESIYYSLRSESVGGLFRYDFEEGYEQRIFHKEDLDIDDLEHHPKRGELLCSIGDGVGRNIALVGNCRYNLRFLTEGDSHDRAPSWVPGEEDSLVYQSAGIGRNQSGLPVGVANSTIEKLNLKTGHQETVLEDERYDFLSPKADAEGNLYCIRRPYCSAGQPVGWGKALGDFLMIPFRLLKALFGFLNMMTQVFGKQNLTNATTGSKQVVDLREVYIKERMLDISKLDSNGEDASVIPADWELVRLSPDGNLKVLGNRIGDFGYCGSGAIVHTNGFSIFKQADGKTELLYRSKEIVESVRALRGLA